MKILITGGAGFIGSNFIHYWLDKYPKDEIINLDKLTYAGNLLNLKEVQDQENYSFVKGDICDYKLVSKLVKKVDLIVHFAAESHNDRSIENAFPFIKTNVEGTLNLLEAARIYNVRMHHISTDEVYGSLPLDKPKLKFTEDTAYDPSSPYSASKASSDHLAKAYFRTHKLPITISNCSNNYGPYQGPEKLIPLVITRAMNDQKIPVYGSGKQIRDWIHVYDHCRGIDLVLKQGKLGETYLLGGDGERENIWIIHQILKKLNRSEDLIVHVGDRKGHDSRYAIDYLKAKKILKFKPLKKLETWLDDTISWYQNNEKIWMPLKKSADRLAEKYLNNKL